MAVEAPGPISALNPNWPEGSDVAREGAPHIRVVKESLQIQFPNLDAVVERTPSEMNALEGASSGNPLQAQIDALTAALDALEEIGDIKMRGAVSADARWLPCDGAAVSRVTYADLFTVIGETFGAGDGVNTFNVPDLQGRSPVGSGTGAGLTARAIGDQGGEEAHALTEEENGPHDHSYSRAFSTATHDGDGTAHFDSNQTVNTGSSGSGTPHNTMHPFTTVAFYIKASL